MKSIRPTPHRSEARPGLHPAGISAILFLLLLLVGAIDGSSAGTAAPQAPEQASKIGIPSIPIVLNGFPSSPEALGRFAGRDLHYVLDPKAAKGGVLYVFLSPEQRDAFLEARGYTKGSSAISASTAGPAATFWEHENHSGSSIQYSTNVASLGRWSDVISSLETGTRAIILWEHERFGGSSFYIPADTIYEELRTSGWNDVASSIQFL